MQDDQLAAARIALVVRVVEALAHLHHEEARLGDRHHVAELAAALEDAAHVAAVDVVEREVAGALDHAEVDDLRDAGVRQLRRAPGLVEELADEVRVLGDARKDPLDRDQPAIAPGGTGAKHLGHAADADPLEQNVLAEDRRLLHRLLPSARSGGWNNKHIVSPYSSDLANSIEIGCSTSLRPSRQFCVSAWAGSIRDARRAGR